MIKYERYLIAQIYLKSNTYYVTDRDGVFIDGNVYTNSVTSWGQVQRLGNIGNGAHEIGSFGMTLANGEQYQDGGYIYDPTDTWNNALITIRRKTETALTWNMCEPYAVGKIQEFDIGENISFTVEGSDRRDSIKLPPVICQRKESVSSLADIYLGNQHLLVVADKTLFDAKDLIEIYDVDGSSEFRIIKKWVDYDAGICEIDSLRLLTTVLGVRTPFENLPKLYEGKTFPITIGDMSNVDGGEFAKTITISSLIGQQKVLADINNIQEFKKIGIWENGLKRFYSAKPTQPISGTSQREFGIRGTYADFSVDTTTTLSAAITTDTSGTEFIYVTDYTQIAWVDELNDDYTEGNTPTGIMSVNILAIGNELLLLLSKPDSSGKLAVQRGYNGTTITTHANETPIFQAAKLSAKNYLYFSEKFSPKAMSNFHFNSEFGTQKNLAGDALDISNIHNVTAAGGAIENAHSQDPTTFWEMQVRMDLSGSGDANGFCYISCDIHFPYIERSIPTIAWYIGNNGRLCVDNDLTYDAAPPYATPVDFSTTYSDTFLLSPDIAENMPDFFNYAEGDAVALYKGTPIIDASGTPTLYNRYTKKEVYPDEGLLPGKGLPKGYYEYNSYGGIVKIYFQPYPTNFEAGLVLTDTQTGATGTIFEINLDEISHPWMSIHDLSKDAVFNVGDDITDSGTGVGVIQSLIDETDEDHDAVYRDSVEDVREMRLDLNCTFNAERELLGTPIESNFEMSNLQDLNKKWKLFNTFYFLREAVATPATYCLLTNRIHNLALWAEFMLNFEEEPLFGSVKARSVDEVTNITGDVSRSTLLCKNPVDVGASLLKNELNYTDVEFTGNWQTERIYSDTVGNFTGDIPEVLFSYGVDDDQKNGWEFISEILSQYNFQIIKTAAGLIDIINLYKIYNDTPTATLIDIQDVCFVASSETKLMRINHTGTDLLFNDITVKYARNNDTGEYQKTYTIPHDYELPSGRTMKEAREDFYGDRKKPLVIESDYIYRGDDARRLAEIKAADQAENHFFVSLTLDTDYYSRVSKATQFQEGDIVALVGTYKGITFLNTLNFYVQNTILLDNGRKIQLEIKSLSPVTSF